MGPAFVLMNLKKIRRKSIHSLLRSIPFSFSLPFSSSSLHLPSLHSISCSNLQITELYLHTFTVRRVYRQRMCLSIKYNLIEIALRKIVCEQQIHIFKCFSQEEAFHLVPNNKTRNLREKKILKKIQKLVCQKKKRAKYRLGGGSTRTLFKLVYPPPSTFVYFSNAL